MATSSRIQIGTGKSGELGVSVAFDAVERALSIAGQRHEAIFVVGLSVYEEFVAYTRHLKRSIEYGQIAIGNTASHPFDELKPLYWGNTATLRKVVGFLNSSTPPFDMAISEQTLINIPSGFIDDIKSSASAYYINSRKVTSGADRDMLHFFENFDGINFDGPLVILSSDRRLTYLQWLCIDRWSQRRSPRPCVILVERDAETPDMGKNIIYRQPVSRGELVSFLAESGLGHTREIDKYFDLWKTGRYYGDSSEFDLSISTYQCTMFVEFLQQVGNNSTPEDLVYKSIPQKISAPVMFAQVGAFIGVDTEPAQGLTSAAAKGASRALRSQAHDLIASGALQNAAPGLGNVLARIAAIADRLERADIMSEADIIEFGVDFSFFEARLFDAKDRLGEMSKGEALGFAAEARRFLSRFDSWLTYAADVRENAIADAEAAALSASFMESALTAGLLTEEAKQKVEGALSSPELDDNTREGIARSSESLAATVGRNALDTLKSVGDQTLTEAKNTAAKEIVSGSKEFLTANAGTLMRLAQLRGGQWLQMLAEFFGGQNN
jgi:hypothetical protein